MASGGFVVVCVESVDSRTGGQAAVGKVEQDGEQEEQESGGDVGDGEGGTKGDEGEGFKEAGVAGQDGHVGVSPFGELVCGDALGGRGANFYTSLRTGIEMDLHSHGPN